MTEHWDPNYQLPAGSSKLVLPLAVDQTKKGKLFRMNLNVYRNTHFQTLNKVKKTFQDSLQADLQNLPQFVQVTLHYVLYPRSLQELDVSNVLSIVDKFTCDALVEAGKLQDDCFKFVTKVTYEMGNIAPTNPRAELFIHPNPVIRKFEKCRSP